MSEIRAGIRQAEESCIDAEPSGTDPDTNNLYASMYEINHSHRVMLPPADGFKGWLRLRLYALLSQPFESINRYHVLVLHLLNKLVKVLDGSNDDLTGELLTQTRNRMDLIEAMSHRIAYLEQKVTALEQRLGEKDAR